MRLVSKAPRLLPAFASSFLPAHTVPFISQPPRFLCATTQAAVVAKAKIPSYVRPVVPGKPLHRFVDDKAQSRSDIIRAITAYVKEHNLQDDDDRRIFHCDAQLKSVLGVESCTFLQVLKFITPLLKKPEEVGGRYLKEAAAVEEAYIEAQRSQTKKKVRTKSQARKQGAIADKKAGRHLFRPMVLSDELAAVCRSSEMQRHEVIKAVWNYIRMNNLQGQGPPENPIKCDFLLRKVYKADYINVRTVMSGISPHVKKKE